MADHLLALPSGHRLEEFEIRQVLSLGPYGIKYVGFDHEHNSQVAIKEYLPDGIAVRSEDTVVPRSSADAQPFRLGLRRFLEEARIQSRLDQSNLAKVHRPFQANGTGYVVMEYVEGETLSAILAREGTLDDERLKSIVHPVLTPLEMAHDIGFLHQEIRPGNIVVRADGSPVLLDLGGGRMAVGGARQTFGDRTRGADLARPTAGFAALEQYSSRSRLGAWTDIYALGAVMYNCVTGHPPPDAPSRAIDDEMVPAVQAGQGRYDERTLAGIDKALVVQAGNRPSSIPAWRTHLPYGDAPDADVNRSGHMARRSTRVAARGFGGTPKPASDASSDSGSRRGFGWIGPTVAALVFIGMLTYVDVGLLRSADGDAASRVPVAATPTGQVAPSMATLVVRTEPAGAEVLIGEEAKGETPLELSDLNAGTYDVTLRHPYYDTVELPSQALAAGEPTVIEQTLARASGALTITTEPAGAFIEIEGQRRPETTPTTLEDLPAGPLTLALGAEDYRRTVVDAEVPKDGTGTVELTLVSSIDYGTLTLALSPPDATVTLPDAAPSYVPGMQLPEGEYRLTVSRQGYQPTTRNVDVVGDVQLALSLAIDPQPFTIAVTPAEARVSILASNESYSPGVRLVPGEYRAQAVRIGFETWQETVRHGNTPTLVDVALVPGVAEFADPLASGGNAPAMVLVPSGDFRMGCQAATDCRDSELPSRDVVVSTPFALSKFEVTFDDYERFTQASGRPAAPSPRGWQRGMSPVVNVSWEDATAYAAWLTAQTGRQYRLPTEAEWEFAARAGSSAVYSWGNEIGTDQANCNGCGSRWDNIRTAPAGSFNANSWGLHDMHGNVWEWVQDCYHADYVDAPASAASRDDGDCTQRILRGGSWANSAAVVRSAVREWDNVAVRATEIGFRVAAAAD